MFGILGGPQSGRGKDIVAREMCRKAQVACVRIFGCVGLAPGMMNRKFHRRKVKVSQTDISTVLGWNWRCQIIFVYGCDGSGS